VVTPRYLVALALGGVGVAFGLTRADPAAPSAAESFCYRLPKDLHFVGSLSCASAACHAANGDRPGSEYTTWASGDPHSNSYRVLTEPRSRRMVELLHGDKAEKATPAHQDARCLACHSPGGRLDARGVGCESCHGPAERWLTVHYQDEFKALSRREKAEQYGLHPTKDLAYRITMCASCHVGDAGREVDHDLIAAGHPRLAFEYTGFHHNPKYHRHWRETAYGPDFDARAWEIGQAACARSAAKLLASRASTPDHVWPELSEYSCYACHKPIDEPRSATSRKPGTLPRSRWYFAMLPTDETVSVRKLMEGSPNREQVAAAANRLADQLDVRLRDLQQAADADSRMRPYSSAQLANRFDAIVRQAISGGDDWDSLALHALGADAFYYAWGEVDPHGRPARLRDGLHELNRWLAFPKGYNSPKDADAGRLLDRFRQLQLDSKP
jgi:Cytochrome c554 and c-prime